MRIRSLTFRGVGPYRDRQHVDFDQLGDSGLYLINGPTGSGKSTIIDCICFALYGRLAGEEADLSRMRSDFAGPTEPTEVDLVFETAAGTFRVIRSPEYRRAKERGSGETVSKATCRLFRVLPDGQEETIATGVSSATKELRDVVGLDHGQFVQTVVLPQGQFATFLYSGTEERTEILKRIFNTRLYEQVAEILKEDAKAAAAARVAATDLLLAEIRQLAVVVGLGDEVRDRLLELATSQLDTDLTGALDALVPELTTDVEAATGLARTADEVLQQADAARAQATAETDAEQAVAQARAAAERAQAAVARAREPLGPLTGLAAELSIALDAATEPGTWRQRATTAATVAGALQAMVGLEREVLAWPEQEAQERAAIAELRRQEADDRARQSELPALIDAQQAIADTRPTMAEGTQAAERLAELDAVRRQYAQLDEQEQQLPGLDAAVQADLAAVTTADAEYQATSRAYRDGIAADLAQHLEPEQPCPVCGATDHPQPAQHAGTAVTYDDVEEARTQAGNLQAVLERSRLAAESVRDAVARLQAEIPVSRDDLTAALEALARDQEALAARGRSADAAEQALTTLRAEAQQVADRIAASGIDIATRESALDTRAASMRADAEQVATARGSSPSVAARHADAQALERALGALADALTGLETALGTQASAEAALAAHPAREGFGDVAAAQAAWVEADAARLAAEGVRSAAESRLGHLRAGIAAIGRLCDERVAVIASSADLLDLAGLFTAGRGSDVGLHVYVLQTLFDTVMESANLRFESLLNGRYRLVPAPEGTGDQRSRQGLGVSVEDRLTGTTRSAKSLSGGETFCASLALALGLSDVVRMTAGGIEIGSLFIDEGFGSLDNDQLDEVMVMLGHLSSGGRRVGVISHVDSMKSTITERIDVTPVGDDRPTSLTVSWMTQ